MRDHFLATIVPANKRDLAGRRLQAVLAGETGEVRSSPVDLCEDRVAIPNRARHVSSLMRPTRQGRFFWGMQITMVMRIITVAIISSSIFSMAIDRDEAKPSGTELLSFQQRLKSLMGNDSQAMFARRVGLSQAGLHGLLNGKQPGLLTLIAIANETGKTVGWLANGEQDDSSAGDEVLVQKLELKASAGTGQMIENVPTHTTIPFPKRVLDRLGLSASNARILEASGTSMVPTINDGDLLIIDISQQSPIDNQIFAFTIDNELFVKRLLRVPGQGWDIVSDNPLAQKYPMPKGEHIRILGRVKWTERAL